MTDSVKKATYNIPFIQKPVVIYERACGHKIVFAYKEGEAVNISTWAKTGSINETAEINGVSHFLEHLMFKGTTHRKAGEFDRILEAKGAIVNAATWKDYTFYYVTLPRGENNKNFKLATELHADMMLNPIIPDCEIGAEFDADNPPEGEPKRERHVVIEEIRMREDQPWTKVYNLANAMMYENHPYKRDVIGTPKLIAGMPRNTVMDYYKKFYTPENLTTIVAGDVDVEKTFEMLDKLFDFKGRENTVHTPTKPEFCVKEFKYAEKTADVTTGFLTAGCVCPPATEYRENIILEIINIILGEGQSSRLYQNLVEKSEKPIFNIVSTDYYSFKDGGNFFIQANFDPVYRDEAIRLIEKEVEKILTERVSDEEFKKAVKKLKVRFAQSAETVSEIAETIGFYMTVCNSLEGMSEYEKILETVTVDDVLQTAQKYLTKDKTVLAVLMPR